MPRPQAPERLRIVQIIPSLVVGGAERMATWLAQAQRDAGHDVHLVVLKRGGELGATLSPDLARRTWMMDKRSRWDVSVLPRLIRTLGHLAPDVVHTHLFTSLSWGSVAARTVGVPVVVHTQHAVHDDEHAYLPSVRRALAPMLDAIVGCNDATVRDLMQRRYAPDIPAVAIDNGIPLADRPLAVQSAGPLFVGAVGRLVPIKGHTFLIDAVALARQRGADVRLVLLGDGPERAALAEQIAQAKLHDVVSMPGAVHDVDQRLTGFGLFCQPSLSEAMPMAVLEAAAAGLPLLLTDAGGAATLLEHDGGGWVVPPGDIYAMADVLCEVAAMPAQQRQAVGQHARNTVLAKYDIQQTAQRYEALYRKYLVT